MGVEINEDWTAVLPFTVWPLGDLESDARSYQAGTATQAAEGCGRDDYSNWQGSHRVYHVRDGVTGQLWIVTVGVVNEPSFVALDASEVPMPAATHVLWGGRVLCGDLRLRGVPRDWPADQRWISLKDVADGAAAPLDPCSACWTKAPGLVEDIRQIGSV